MIEHSRLAERRYGAIMWGDGCFTTIYWVIISLALCVCGVAGVASPLFQLEILISTIVGLLGLFIALRLANRERNKRITENHFYKSQILWHLWKMLDNTSVFFDRVHMAYQDEEPDKNGRVERFKKTYMTEYNYYASRIEMLNTNTHVPADIRDRILLLVRTAHIPIEQYHPYPKRLNVINVESSMLKPLDQLLDAEYFTGSKSAGVKEWLCMVNTCRHEIRDRVKMWKEKT